MQWDHSFYFSNNILQLFGLFKSILIRRWQIALWWISLQDLIDKFHKNPKRIFNIPDQPNTYVEVDLDEEWVIPEALRFTKSKWTPFAGKKIRGSVHRVVLRGEVAYIDGEVLVNPGYGQDIREVQARLNSQMPLHPPPTVDVVISRPNSVMEGLLSPNCEKRANDPSYDEQNGLSINYNLQIKKIIM